MKDKKFSIQSVDILGIIAYVIIVISCFLPFLEYTTVMGSSELTYFQGNGKILLAVSILATVLIFLKKFKFIIICLGLSIGVFTYDIIFGLLKVAREITSEQTLKIGFFLIAFGLVINLVYVIVKMKKGYQENPVEIDKEDKEIVEEEFVDVDNYENDLENNFEIELDNQTIENINDDIEELDVNLKHNNIEKSDISIFSAMPDLDIDNNYTNSYEEFEIENKNHNLKYKVCPRCGMQMDYDHTKCIVCGKEF